MGSSRTKSLSCLTCCAVTSHFTLTQGCGVPVGGNGQPTMVNVSEARSTGVPALARVDPGVAMTVPPCGHIMTLAAVSGEGIRSPPARRC